MPSKINEAVICDANVLIDYASVDEDIIREIVAYWKKVYIPDSILYEVKELSSERAKELGLIIIDTPFNKLPERLNLSFQDRTCLFYIINNNWTCIANDVVLQNECIKAGGQIIKGIEMLFFLVENKQISKNRAKDIATKIFKINPEITEEIINIVKN